VSHSIILDIASVVLPVMVINQYFFAVQAQSDFLPYRKLVMALILKRFPTYPLQTRRVSWLCTNAFHTIITTRLLFNRPKGDLNLFYRNALSINVYPESE